MKKLPQAKEMLPNIGLLLFYWNYNTEISC